MNPLLYNLSEAEPQCFNDINVGSNHGGNRLLPVYVACEHGFEADMGWDPTSGVGSPNFEQLLMQVQ